MLQAVAGLDWVDVVAVYVNANLSSKLVEAFDER